MYRLLIVSSKILDYWSFCRNHTAICASACNSLRIPTHFGAFSIVGDRIAFTRWTSRLPTCKCTLRFLIRLWCFVDDLIYDGFLQATANRMPSVHFIEITVDCKMKFRTFLRWYHLLFPHNTIGRLLRLFVSMFLLWNAFLRQLILPMPILPILDVLAYVSHHIKVLSIFNYFNTQRTAALNIIMVQSLP